MPQDWTECPEAAGPVTEAAATGYGPSIDYQALAQHSVRLPQLDQSELQHGRYVPLSGAIPYALPPEIRDRERDAAARTFERRQLIERAAIAAGQAALEAGATADSLMQQAAAAADKAVG